jgi:hypothetical protein
LRQTNGRRLPPRRRTTAANPLLNATVNATVNVTVTCTGTTANQNDSGGYGTGKETNLNICRPAQTQRRRKRPRQRRGGYLNEVVMAFVTGLIFGLSFGAIFGVGAVAILVAGKGADRDYESEANEPREWR